MIFGEPEPGEPFKQAIDSVDFHFALVIVIRMEQDRLRAWVPGTRARALRQRQPTQHTIVCMGHFGTGHKRLKLILE